MATRRVLVVMGSGETTPTMVTVHREVTARVEPRPGRAVLLDTPYGFQENAADISAKAQAYFARSVGLRVDVAPGLDGRGEQTAGRGLAMLQGADWVFAGPGSPTYALTHWSATPVGDVVRGHVNAGTAAVVFASAAACLLGRYTVPVYEIYKVGGPPQWAGGLDLLAAYDLHVAVIPHYDNTEGGTHDTRYCYLGERRLAAMEAQLPEEAAVLGIDEHTAAVIIPDDDSVEIHGRGGLTVRRRGRSTTLAAGERVTLTQLRELATTFSPRSAVRLQPPEQPGRSDASGARSIKDIVLDAERRFDVAADAVDADAMVRAVLEIDAAVAEWGADTEEDEGTEWARAIMHAMVSRIGGAIVRPDDEPRVTVTAAAVQTLVDVRDELRRRNLYGLADSVRDALTSSGVELRDTPGGTTWDGSG